MSDSGPDAWAPPSGPPVAPSAGQRRTKRWPKVVMWGGIVLMIIGFVGLIGEWATRNWEMSQLLAKVENSESTMVAAKDRIASVELPEDASDADVAAASAEIEQLARESVGAVEQAGDQVGEVTFLPWHTEIIDAQGAYLAHNQAWVDYLNAGSQDAVTLFGDDNNISPTWAAAEVRVRAAIPYVPWPNIPNQVDRIFEDSDDQQEQPDDSDIRV